MKCVTCDTCGQLVREEDAIHDTRTGLSWHVEHYGGAEEIEQRIYELTKHRASTR